jgi:hypothetical protein
MPARTSADPREAAKGFDNFDDMEFLLILGTLFECLRIQTDPFVLLLVSV